MRLGFTRLERARIERVKTAKERLERAKYELEVAQREGQYEKASRIRFGTIPELMKQLPRESEGKAEESSDSPLSMLHDRVTSSDIARVVARATGIPVQNLLKGEKEKLVHVSFRVPYYSSFGSSGLQLYILRWRTHYDEE